MKYLFRLTLFEILLFSLRAAENAKNSQTLAVDRSPMVQTNGPSTEFPRRYFLDPEKRYLLEWKYEHGAANDNGQVTFRVTVKTTGYVGFGLSRNGGMKGADIVIGWVHDGRAYLHDMHGVGNEIPVLDDKTNWILKGGKEENGFTQLTFYRQLDTCDDQDIKIETGAMKVIYSYNEKDPVGGVKSVLYHGTRNRGSNIVYFDDDQQPSFIPEPAMKTKDLTVKNIKIPKTRTFYHCSFHKVVVSGKNHIIKARIDVDGRFLHHTVLYECKKDNYSDAYLQIQGDCKGGGIFGVARSLCQVPVATIGVGSSETVYPKEVGMPISGTSHYLLELHFDNPEYESEHVVNKYNLRLTHTPNLRPHDAGILLVGAETVFNDKDIIPIVIPPRQDRFLYRGHCTPECVNAMISTIKGDEKKQLNLFSVMHHAHLAARAMRTRHFRNGVELPWVMNDETYDFNFQTFRPVKKVVAVKSGDWLTIDCVYNTTDRSNVTFADYASTSEMCLSFISYYPKVPFGFCTTMLDAPKVTNFIWDTKGKDVREFLEAPSTWKDPIANKRFQELTLAADPLQRKNCFTSDLQPSSAYKPWKYEPKKEYKPIENKNTCSQKEVTVKRTQPSVSKKGETVSKPSIPKDKSPSGKAGSSESTPTKIHSHVDASFPRRVYVDPDKKYLLEWKYNRGQPGSNNGSITFRVTVKTTGYVGFGLSRNGGMKGADIVIGWVHHGKAQIYDTHGVGNSIPKLDKVANWKLLNGKEENGFTQLTFSRDLDTCDDEGDIPIQPGTQRMIYAYGGDVDPVDVTKALYHGGANRGVMSYYLLDDPQPSFPPGSDVKTLDITSPNIRLPAQKTTYLCRFVKIDLPAGKKHIIKIEQVMKPGNEKYIHHMVLWACAKGALSDRDLIRGDCFGIRNREKCFEGVAMFAQGSRSVTYPQEAGVSLGGPADSVYYMMQTHYNNPEEQSGIIDDSTIRLSYTSKLRKYDAGNMMVGSMHFLPFSLLIPPRQKRFLVRAFCSDNCLKAAFEKLGNGVNEIKVFSTGPHSHTAARGMRLRHFRNGKELPWILNDMTYDFNSQNWRPRKEFVTVKMGDVLANECYYNTEDRNRVTVGGFSTTDEMCFSMVNYFPKLPMSFCQTSPNPINALVSVWGYLKIMRMVGTDWGKVMGDLNAITDILNRDDTWDGGYDVLLQRHILTTAQNQYCTDQGVPIIKDGAWNYKISNEYRPPIKNVCNRPAKELQAFQTFTIPEAPHWYSAFFGKSFLIICIVIVLLGVLFFARHKIFTKIRSIQYRLLNKTTAYKKLEKL